MVMLSIQMEGVSYRGRIMVEVQMTLGKSPIIPSEPISAHDINSAAVSTFYMLFI